MPEQVKNAYVSTVMRCPTDAGDVYLKLLPGLFMREAAILSTLGEWGMPELPRCLAVDPERGLMLTEDMSGCDLADCCTPELLEKAVREFASFQVASVSLVSPQEPWPFYDWRMSVLAVEIEHVAEDAETLLAGLPRCSVFRTWCTLSLLPRCEVFDTRCTLSCVLLRFVFLTLSFDDFEIRCLGCL